MGHYPVFDFHWFDSQRREIKNFVNSVAAEIRLWKKNVTTPLNV